MKLAIETKQLAGILAAVKPFAPGRSTTMPVLQHVLIKTGMGTATFAMTNLEISGSITVESPSMEEDATTVNFTMLAELVGILKGKVVYIETIKGGSRVKITCGKYVGELPAIEADEFPNLPEVEPTVSLQITAADFTNAINGVAYAASTDESRPTLTGIETIISSTGIMWAATDGYRLTKCTLATPVAMNDGELVKVIIPAVSLTKAAAATKGYEEVEIGIAPELNRIAFTYTAPGQTMSIISALFDARFPDWRAIVPKSQNTKAVIAAEEFRVALKTAMLTARVDAGLIRLGLMNQTMIVSATTTESTAVTEIDATLEGEDLDIAFNGKYLIQSLDSFDCDHVVITASEPTRPITMYGQKAGPDVLLAVIMPMHKER